MTPEHLHLNGRPCCHRETRSSAKRIAEDERIISNVGSSQFPKFARRNSFVDMWVHIYKDGEVETSRIYSIPDGKYDRVFQNFNYCSYDAAFRDYFGSYPELVKLVLIYIYLTVSGERLSPWVGLACAIMGFALLIW